MHPQYVQVQQWIWDYLITRFKGQGLFIWFKNTEIQSLEVQRQKRESCLLPVLSNDCTNAQNFTFPSLEVLMSWCLTIV
jgi:hypothetical protein